MGDLLSDMLTRIRNAQRAEFKKVEVPVTRLHKRVLAVLKAQGYIRDYREKLEARFPMLEVDLKYYNGAPVIASLKRVSTPGHRVYTSIKHLKKVCNGLGIAILSTSQGVLSRPFF